MPGRSKSLSLSLSLTWVAQSLMRKYPIYANIPPFMTYHCIAHYVVSTVTSNAKSLIVTIPDPTSYVCAHFICCS